MSETVAIAEGQRPVVLSKEQHRMMALGMLTAAANALTMGGSADDFAYQRTQIALGLIAPEPVLILTYADVRKLAAGDKAAQDTVLLMIGEPPVPPVAHAGCPVAYCRGEAGHRDLHDIPPCLGTCGPLRDSLGREHDPACPNATWRRR